MKRLLALAVLLGAFPAFAQTRVAASMVKFDASGFTRLTNCVSLQQALAILDPATTGINYAPRSIFSNIPITLVTPRWVGDLEVVYGTGGTNTQVWQSYSTTTSSWLMVYPPIGMQATNAVATNVGPWNAGETLQINGATNILWRAFADTNSVLTWKKIYIGVP